MAAHSLTHCVTSELGTDSIVLRARAVLPEITGRILAAGAGTDIPGALTADLFRVIYLCAQELLTAVEDRRALSCADIARHTTPAILRSVLLEHIPPRVLVRSICRFARQALAEVDLLATPADAAEIAEFAGHLLVLHTQLCEVAYEIRDVPEEAPWSTRASRHALCAALLDGNRTSGIPFYSTASHYTVLAVRIPGPADADARPERYDEFAAAVEDLLGADVLSCPTSVQAGFILLPDPPPTGDGDIAEIQQLPVELADRLGTEVIIAEFPVVAVEALPEAAAEAAALAELAELLGYATGLYRFDDLLLEYQLTRHTVARQLLLDRIEPLREQPFLLESLEAHIRHGSNRKAAAAELYIHPNTLSYRLKRIADLTHYDPSNPSDSRLLAAALTIHRLSPSSTGRPPQHPLDASG